MHINAIVYVLVSVCLAIVAFASHGKLSALGKSGALAERFSASLGEGESTAARIGASSHYLDTLETVSGSFGKGLDSIATDPTPRIRTGLGSSRIGLDSFRTGSGSLDDGRVLSPRTQWNLASELKPSATCGASGALAGWKVNPETGLATFGGCRTAYELKTR